jgi:4'-phosphopantetheinyl transferase
MSIEHRWHELPSHKGQVRVSLRSWPAELHERALEPGRVVVISTPLDLGLAEVRALTSLLSEDERERAGRFRFEQHRHRFIVARARLRQLLGQCQGIAPEQVAFTYGPHGKPALAERNAAGIEFNVAHSGDLALYALTVGSPVGVDVELVRELPKAQAIAESYFSAHERARMLELPQADRNLSFFLAWTRKEAMLKACGKGLSVPLRDFSVSVVPGEPAVVLEAAEELGTGTWSLVHLEPASGYMAALAILSKS